jgi:DNA-binding YbaB/EbfC family protein
MFKGLANLGSLLKQAQEIGGQMKALNEEMKKLRVTGSAGGGMVEIEINGLLEVLQCRIDDELVAQGDRELIEDLVATAVNQAVAKGKQLHAEGIREITSGLPVPGLQDALAKLISPESSAESPGESSAESSEES